MAQAVDPFRGELDWKTEWRGDRWWVVGLFESPWGVRFVQDATIYQGKVYAYIDYGTRPAGEWVGAKAAEWGLKRLYTRLSDAEAIARVKKSDSVRNVLCESVSMCAKVNAVLDSYGEYMMDTAISQGWRFAFYVRRPDGTHLAVPVGGLSEPNAEEGNYSFEYGFGNAAKAHVDIPLNLVDWTRQVARARGWDKATNLK